MFNLKSAFRKVFGRKATTPRKAALATTKPAKIAPQVTIDDARLNLLAVLKAVEEKKNVAEKERRAAACQGFLDFLRDTVYYCESQNLERVCSPLDISPEVIDIYFAEGELPALAAAVEFFVIINGDFDTGLDKAFNAIDTGEYTFFAEVFYDYDLGEMLARNKVDDAIWDYIDFERLGEDFRHDYDGAYVFGGFFAPQKF